MTSRLMRWFGRATPIAEPTTVADTTPAALAALAALADQPATFELDADLFTDTGPVRQRNEDCIAALTAPRPGAAHCIRLVALADGMGGHQAGAVASQLAVQAAMQVFADATERDGAEPTRRRLLAALAAANAAVFERAATDPGLRGMGTTLLLCAPSRAGLCFAWVGDSRLYHWQAGRLSPLSRDDTVVRGLLDRGLIDPGEVAVHPDQSVLTQAIGTRASIAAPHVEGPVALAWGDRLLLCSDGVHDVVADPALAAALGAGSPREARLAIHHLALAAGADDNLSIAVLQVSAPRAPTAVARPTRNLALLS